MPGAPNRPPPTDPPAPIPTDDAGRLALRRLAPMRVALLQDQWKGAPSPDLLKPFDEAEAAYDAGNWTSAIGALDQLAVRLAEPRWPTLPVPFRSLRVSIPAPMPPQWDPEFGLDASQKEAKRAQRTFNDQLALARGTTTWMIARGYDVTAVDAALPPTSPPSSTVDPAVVATIDGLWSTVRGWLPRPRRAGAPAIPPADAEA